MDQFVEIVFSFDTTGSMYPCLARLRANLPKTIGRLFKEVPNLRVGIIAHGDYCDRQRTYVTKHHELTTKCLRLQEFIQGVERTCGGDAPECYELVLHEAKSFNWLNDSRKILVMLGDDEPHPPGYHLNTKNLSWRHEVKDLVDDIGVQVYAVQCLNRRWATSFWSDLARLGNGKHLKLSQLGDICDLVMGVTYHQFGRLDQYEQEVVDHGRMNRSMDRIYSTLRGREPERYSSVKHTLAPVREGRFQVLTLGRDRSIRDFVEENGIKFGPGRGFYELTKSVLIQHHKEIVLMDRATGDMWTGREARDMIGLSHTFNVRFGPKSVPADVRNKYIVFVQSTSYNRKLLTGTKFLYEVEGVAAHA